MEECEEEVDMSLIKRELEKARRSRRIVSIYSDRTSPLSSSVGYVNNIGKQTVSINGLSRDGEPDGIIIRKLANIFKVEVGDRYAQKLTVLSSARARVELAQPVPAYEGGMGTFYTALKRAQSERLVVSVWLETDSDETYTTGFVHLITSKEVLLNKLDDWGRPDGNVIVAVADIEALDVGGVSERRLAFLYAAGEYDYSWPD